MIHVGPKKINKFSLSVILEYFCNKNQDYYYFTRIAARASSRFEYNRNPKPWLFPVDLSLTMRHCTTVPGKDENT